MKTGLTLVYDGSFNGFLSAIYVSYEMRIKVANIMKENEFQQDFFVESQKVKTDIARAKRVWYTLQEKNYERLKTLYFAFLGETSGIEMSLYREIVKLLGGKQIAAGLNSASEVHRIEEMAQKVSREKRKWESSINLNFPQGKAPIVHIRPRYNILPLISRYFRFAFSKSPWIIYDKQRNYGIYYNGVSTSLITEIPEQFNWVNAA